MSKSKPRKYYYETETCHECGHTAKRRRNFLKRGRKPKGYRMVRNISKTLMALKPDDAPVTALLAGAREGK